MTERKTPSHLTQISVMIKALEEFRAVDPDATINTLLIFLHTEKAGGTGVPVESLIKKTNTVKATVSKQTAILSHVCRGKKAGLGLITIEEDPSDRRYKIARSTPLGHELATRMVQGAV